MSVHPYNVQPTKRPAQTHIAESAPVSRNGLQGMIRLSPEKAPRIDDSTLAVAAVTAAERQRHRKAIEASGNLMLGRFPRHHVDSFVIAQPTNVAGYPQAPIISPRRSAAEAQNYASAQMQVQLSLMLDQQRALMQRMLAQCQDTVAAAASRLESRITNIEQACNHLSRQVSDELGDARRERAQLVEQLETVTEDRDRYMRKVVGSPAGPSAHPRPSSPQTRPTASERPNTAVVASTGAGKPPISSTTMTKTVVQPRPASAVIPAKTAPAGQASTSEVTATVPPAQQLPMATNSQHPQNDVKAQNAPATGNTATTLQSFRPTAQPQPSVVSMRTVTGQPLTVGKTVPPAPTVTTAAPITVAPLQPSALARPSSAATSSALPSVTVSPEAPTNAIISRLTKAIQEGAATPLGH